LLSAAVGRSLPTIPRQRNTLLSRRYAGGSLQVVAAARLATVLGFASAFLIRRPDLHLRHR
jgi:hypothetical protein